MTHINPRAVYRDDPRYPPQLAAIPDAPDELWVRGDLEALLCPSVAIVGSRAASQYAVEVATALAFDLVRSGVVVVSGMARGVDGAAHQGALDAGGRTVAVLGCGVDVAYPAEHRQLMDRIVESGCVISEFPPGTAPHQHHFPLRNRIISGLSRAVVVVEAGEKSGSLITARWALEQGRDVMAVPGNALSGRNRGSHALLKDGAKLVEGVDDILEELGLSRIPPVPVADGKSLMHNGLMRVLQPGEAYGLDELCVASGLGAAALLPRLLELELQGVVTRVPGGRFALACKRV
ncbi:MAG TPA: DNA-processing protein DprA [Vicinamibacterales bacterium]|nr:DNA-processing protein DprA [Vicinamibacterales bacterium]